MIFGPIADRTSEGVVQPILCGDWAPKAKLSQPPNCTQWIAQTGSRLCRVKTRHMSCTPVRGAIDTAGSAVTPVLAMAGPSGNTATFSPSQVFRWASSSPSGEAGGSITGILRLELLGPLREVAGN